MLKKLKSIFAKLEQSTKRSINGRSSLAIASEGSLLGVLTAVAVIGVLKYLEVVQ